MTSWLNARAVPVIVERTSYLFETGSGGFCSHFNDFLYAYLYTESDKKSLYVNDIQNPLSSGYPLIKNTFATPADILFTDTYIATATPLNRRQSQMRAFLTNISPSTLRTRARQLLVWNSALVNRLQNIIAANPMPEEGCDVGVHFRSGDKISTGEMRNLSVNQYIDAVSSYQKSSKKEKLNIFVMSDSQSRLNEFQRKKHHSWTIYVIANPNISSDGHVQASFNGGPQRRRMESYIQFMAELYVIQKIPYVITTFTSNVGRFLYLTSTEEARVVSIDTPTFSPI